MEPVFIVKGIEVPEPIVVSLEQGAEAGLLLNGVFVGLFWEGKLLKVILSPSDREKLLSAGVKVDDNDKLVVV